MRYLPVLDRRTKTNQDHGAHQTEQRDRRRKHLTVTYGEDFDLLVEVHDITRPLAAQVAAEPRPMAFRSDVAELAEAIHRLCVVVAALIAAADAERRTAHLNVAERGRAMAALKELAERPQPPEITDGMLSSGLWVEALTEHVGPYTGKLSDLLARAAAPGTRRGLLSASEQVVEGLRVVDLAVVNLERHLARAAVTRASTPRRSARPDLRAELARLGVATDE